MLFAPVSGTEMQAARLLMGATMVGLLAAPMFGRSARHVRAAILVAYILGILGFAAYALGG